MPIYYVDPYKKYYEQLNNMTSMITKSANMVTNAELVCSTISRLQSQLETALWVELGHKELISNSIPNLSKSAKSLSNNISSNLKVAVDTAMNSLLPTVTELKEKDLQLENKKNELSNLKEPPTSTNPITGEKTSNYIDYCNTKAALENEISTLDKICQDLVAKANSFVEQINGVSSKTQTVQNVEVSTTPTISTETVLNYSGVKEYTLSDSMIIGKTDTLINYGEYYVVNTAYSVEDYQRHILNKRIYQSGSNGFENSCSTIAHVYAKNLTMGYAYDDIRAAVKDGGSSPDGYYNKNLCISDNKQEVLSAVYSELSQGRPVTLNCANSNGGRHWITIVGFKTDVSSGQELKAEDLLILDPWDGQVERMDCSDSRIMATGSETGQTRNYTGYRIDRLNDNAIAEIPKNKLTSA